MQALFFKLTRQVALVCLTAGLTTCCLTAMSAEDTADWTYFGGSRAFDRYSAADQISAENIHNLQIVWRRPALDPQFRLAHPEIRLSGNLRSTPIFIDGTLYATNGVGLAEAFDPATG